jgi:transcriptional regulator with GAF, ATPase, and Fis domain
MSRLTATASAFETDPVWLDFERMERAAMVGPMVVKSTAMSALMRLLTRVGAYRTTVLVQGESGTGKELVARAVHELRAVPRGPFVTFNCSNLVESLAESQLFGHIKGAFTDARSETQGYFQAAHGGVLFLDEVGELPLGLQSKLLRAVECRVIQPVGSTHGHSVDVQIVAATNRDLHAAVKAGRFRADLFYRLNVAMLTVPPLRERLEALDALAACFVARCNREFGTAVKFISRRAMERLLDYGWPGNVRELEHAIRYAVLLADGDRIDLGHLPVDIVSEAPETAGALGRYGELNPAAPSANAIPTPCQPLEEPASLDALTRDAVLSALRHAHGNRQRAARILGISRTTLYRMLVRYELPDLGRASDLKIEPRPGALRLVKA